MSWQPVFGANLGYVYEQYERYLKDPQSVDPSLRMWFEGGEDVPREHSATADADIVAAAVRLATNIRTYGHRAAKINPLEKPRQIELLNPERYGLREADLEKLPGHFLWEGRGKKISNAKEAIYELIHVYAGSIGYQFSHVDDESERRWLYEAAESEVWNRPLSSEQKIALLRRLVEVAEFESFLHRTFAGQKRFSIEGVDMLVPMMDELVSASVRRGARDIAIGMAHRGRLNVLAHVLGKPYGLIFSEFHHAPDKDLVPSEGSMGINDGWTGDVKYHLGADRAVREKETYAEACVMLSDNPSHLEFVDPVVLGSTRAAQEDRTSPGFPRQDTASAMAVLVHGDAAFPGEGIVAETLNLSGLPGFRTGGTVHIIANNQLGFTTEQSDARSTQYAGDLAKGFEIPIVHVNADEPEQCLHAVRFALEYRWKFRKDVLIDLIGYRRFGHNEMDDPAATQPSMYEKINRHPGVSEQYARQLMGEGILDESGYAKMRQEIRSRLQEAYERMKTGGLEKEKTNPRCPAPPRKKAVAVETAVPLETLKAINDELLEFPDNFHVYPKVKRILSRRKEAFSGEGNVDWALAETMAFATLLCEGKPVRLTGQDTERGTFAQRHLILHDVQTGKRFCPLHALKKARASFAIHNSPLSENSVLGFEYGYQSFAKDMLVLWEAQYGDFANAAQVIIDQFLASGRAKWGKSSGLVLLLPHGYEGQGPDHSSARLERFLQLAAENNWTVANMTKASQYFHLLRKQAFLNETEETRPLVIMTPKSLLRHEKTRSKNEEFARGAFRSVLPDPLNPPEENVRRLVLCSGKVAVDLQERREKAARDKKDEDLFVLRIEQLYPFPKEEIARHIRRFDDLEEMVWLQEEPRNMGAWSYMEPRLRELAPRHTALRYAGRPERSSPATGYPDVHSEEQERLLQQVMQPRTFSNREEVFRNE